MLCYQRLKAESEALRGKPKGALESEIRNAGTSEICFFRETGGGEDFRALPPPHTRPKLVLASTGRRLPYGSARLAFSPSRAESAGVPGGAAVRDKDGQRPGPPNGVRRSRQRRPHCICAWEPDLEVHVAFDVGSHMILNKNLMLESMPERVNRPLAEEEMRHYRKGFEEPGEARRPMLSLIRSIPVAGEPADVVNIMDAGSAWLKSSDLPILFVSVEPGTMTPGDRDFVRTLRNVTEVAVAGGHMVTEDSPDDVGMNIAKWLRESVL